MSANLAVTLFLHCYDTEGPNPLCHSCGGFHKATLVYIDERCGQKYLGMFSTVRLSENMMTSLFAVPRKRPTSSGAHSVRHASSVKLNSKRQAPEQGKRLCNLSSDIVLRAALPRKWKNVERALSNPSQHNESSFSNYCNWDAALLSHASSYNKLKKPKSNSPLWGKKGGCGITWCRILWL